MLSETIITSDLNMFLDIVEIDRLATAGNAVESANAQLDFIAGHGVETFDNRHNFDFVPQHEIKDWAKIPF